VTDLPAPKACRETCAVAHDPNLQTSMKPDSIEEGDRVINPKAPSTPPTPSVMVPLSEVATIATRIWELFWNIAVPILIGRREYKIGQCEYGIDYGESTGAVESPTRRL
jgi:hypothetical protein